MEKITTDIASFEKLRKNGFCLRGQNGLALAACRPEGWQPVHHVNPGTVVAMPQPREDPVVTRARLEAEERARRERAIAEAKRPSQVTVKAYSFKASEAAPGILSGIEKGTVE